MRHVLVEWSAWFQRLLRSSLNEQFDIFQNYHSIDIQMTSSIDISKDTRSENGFVYEIDIDAHREVVPLITTRWSPEAYKKQWVEALKFLVASRSSRCALIICIQPESDSYGITYWALFREGDFVYFQERFIRENYRRFLISPSMVERYMPDRMEGAFEEYSKVSEWILPISYSEVSVVCKR